MPGAELGRGTLRRSASVPKMAANRCISWTASTPKRDPRGMHAYTSDHRQSPEIENSAIRENGGEDDLSPYIRRYYGARPPRRRSFPHVATTTSSPGQCSSTHRPLEGTTSHGRRAGSGGMLLHKVDLRDHGMFSGAHHELKYFEVPTGSTLHDRCCGRPNRVLVSAYRNT